MLDWVILHALAHYLPPEAMAILCLLLMAWVVFENWLAKTGRIKANCTLDLVTKGWIAPIAAGLKGMVSKNGTLDVGSGSPEAAPASGLAVGGIGGSGAGSPGTSGNGAPREPGRGAGGEDAGGVGGQGGGGTPVSS